ncbi:hypothetical protein OH655_15905 [Pantoea dispersa]|uniref:hypothetical protein n=1 Tax=Pantoea TaxID=53335 RepID=UPI00073F7AFA|nr:hypothetical protein [Pantoea dispersa]UYV56911.1 hypothetical protein OH655_15905 [Pantoea dispersa]
MVDFNEFKLLVKLYRLINRPELDNNQCTFDGILTQDAHVILNEIWSNDNSLSEFTLLNGANEISTTFGDPCPQYSSDVVKLSIVFPSGDFTFKKNILSYLQGNNHLNKSEPSYNVYLSDEDYDFSESDENVTGNLKSALGLAKIINGLKLLSSYYYDDKISGCLNLVFIDSNPEIKDTSAPIVITPKITSDHLEKQLDSVDIIDNIMSSDIDRLHKEEKSSLFRVSILELLNIERSGGNPFDKIVNNWDVLLSIYRGNFEAYLTKFSFLKQKKAASENYIELSSKISSCLSGISGKLFGLPVSLAVPLAIFKSKDSFESLLLLLGVYAASLLIFITTQEQRKIINAISSSIDSTFSYSEANNGSDLFNLINSQKEKLKSQAKKLKFWMVIFSFIAWVPSLISTKIYFNKFIDYATIENTLKYLWSLI